MEDIIERHRAFAKSGRNRSASFRISRLEGLRKALADYREEILAALYSDLRKPEMEAYASEFSPVIHEIDRAKRHLRRWMRPRRKGRGRSVVPTPYGAALIIGTWNYPVQLTLSPLVAAIAAGNGATVKPSELAPATAEVLRNLLQATFEPDAVAVELGGPDVAAALVDSGYDKVFFTGSPRVGALVAESAAKHHSDVTLELGGKSPAIVGSAGNLEFAAKRIAWGKFLNAGQTCLAPDYVLVPKELADAVVRELEKATREFFGSDPSQSPDLGRLVNERHFDRLTALLDAAGVSTETNREELFISPTVVRCGTESPLMGEELFGPILPVVTYGSFDELAAIVHRHRDPLATYVFTKDRAFERRVIRELDFGGGMVNDVILHAVDPRLPFGGRGSSGTGAYHGKYGFETFSHQKGIIRRRQGRAASLRFPPYGRLPSFVRKMMFGV
mgnify:CR=1 FL=1